MKQLKHIAALTALALNVLLLFLLVFEHAVHIPAWLQIGGRMHPLVLHFPIVLLLLVAVVQLPFRKAESRGHYVEPLLLAASLTAAATALSGLLLSQEAAYNKDELAMHKWMGVGISLLAFAWLHLYKRISNIRWAGWLIPAAATGMLLIGGHSGAGITHGEGFLLEPVSKDAAKPALAFNDALVYRDMVQPILQEKCIGCHSTRKAKGELVMETEAMLLKGGKSGALWDTAATDLGLMMQRIHMPLQEKKHMPPVGKPQLTEEESTVLGEWIRLGASFALRVADLPDSSNLRILATAQFNSAVEEVYDFAEANAGTVKKLNTANRVVFALAQGSPALVAQFYGPSQYNAKQLDELQVVKEQIVSLSLSKMPVKDADLRTVASFVNLRRLNLAFSEITAAGLKQLSGLKHLKELTLSGTQLGSADLQALAGWPALNKLYAWSTPVRENERAALEKQLKRCRIVWGYNGDTLVLPLNPPIIQNEKQIIDGSTELLVKHYLPGVALRYTLDGSDPDSLRSPIFMPGKILDSAATFRVKAFKPGWLSSEIAEKMFYKNRFHPDTVILNLPPADGYKANGGATLNDLEKGDNNFRSGKWLGYKDNRMEALLLFNKPIEPSKVSLSSLVDIASYIMPPLRIEVWGGSSPSTLQMLTSTSPMQPLKEAPVYLQGYDLRFLPRQVSCLKVVAVPVNKLPAWHRGKGDKGWVFADEIFVN